MAIGAEEQVRAALAAAEAEAARPEERAEMLMEIAVGLQVKPKSAGEIRAAVELYDRALEICPSSHLLLAARIAARKATALQAIPEDGTVSLEQARDALQGAVPAMREHATAEELAETEMNLGLVLQSLAGFGKARIVDAISAYQRALRTFDRVAYPKEYAILQNNLATAFLSIPLTDERAKMREALAVQAFEEGLKVVDLIEHPAEYAMLQNNLGNALQYASSSHAVENNLRAIEAYDEALKVRSRQSMPLEYANTLANKANCLWNLPDDVDDPASGNPGNMAAARKLEILGLDPLYLANEGKLVAVVPPSEADAALAALRSHAFGRDAAAIGEVGDGEAGRVTMRTAFGGTRIVDMLVGEQLPRIC